ncbi:MAG: hypothetical protein QM490_05575 [Candidatus Gracilibacteria bacterium]
MKKLLLITIIFFSFFQLTQANYKLEIGSQDFVQKYNINIQNLNQEITRKDFVETLYKWYPDYKKDRGIVIDMTNFAKLDNSKIFKDIDLNSDFGKKLSYFAGLGSFSKNEYFNPNDTMSKKTFFIVMSRLRIMFSLQNCKYHKICEREADEKTLFLKGTYLKYASKIMNKSLRKYYSNPQDYIKAGYKAYLSTNYYFPLKGQTLNGCYAFSVRNILKYKDGIGIYIPKIEKDIGKKPSSLWNYYTMDKFDDYSHIDKSRYYNIDTLISSLQAGEPVAISYMLEYYSYKYKAYKQVPHIVAAYSFDENGVWVAETVSAQRKLVPWNKVFNKNGSVALNRIFKYYYNLKHTWNSSEVVLENNNNYLVGEY